MPLSIMQGLLLHALPPAACELLLHMFEAADGLSAMQAHRDGFYTAVYGVVQDPGQLLRALLAGKERVAECACRQVHAEALGYDV